jgi:hypothetical protein
MFLRAECSHFVIKKSELRLIEPTVVHEMTHSCLAHLPIPAWLNEGLAVNTERRLSPSGALESPAELYTKHLVHWDENTIQHFWSGKSWMDASGDANKLSYDLAKILVEQFAKQWDSFKQFANAADMRDAGQDAAVKHLETGLGAAVCAILQKDYSSAWEPNPSLWDEGTEKGAFRQASSGV